jgi:hypothetical protein
LQDFEDLVGRGPVEFTLRVSSWAGGWQDAGHLVVRTTVPPEDGISFDPVANKPPGVEMVPAVVERIRERAYSGSRRGRHSDRDADRPGTTTGKDEG